MVEDVLVQSLKVLLVLTFVSLNPCCGGRCSSTSNLRVYAGKWSVVLILVVVEDVLVLQQTTFNKQQVCQS